ncbi:hypothetical protein AJ80_01782 [Polytolypa hystricis UAMH7299]|uniref:Acid phosphatase n=1 Tax=Polytolypa hystricis (strain UAMH7299) TaxID=1447883 RepID=A0A2B7YZQ1_POLH7|nr:hypothetical protein AJ80_01782 [Polytolypa hystricis UAMH7299]
MTSLVPRAPYSKEELEKLYPKGLELQLVQVPTLWVKKAATDVNSNSIGERSPVSSRFQNAGLTPYWPYCNVARSLASMAATTEDLSKWDSFQWRRKIEQFGSHDQARIAVGPEAESDGICTLGELTDLGRQSTYALGTRLRRLYVDQLGFMPKIRSDTGDMYLRATPIPRALESLQQAFWGMYPSNARTADFTTPTIVSRTPAEETLFPNEGNCHRFRQLARMFAQRAADTWNDSEEMTYLNSVLGKWMPPGSPRIKVDSRPRLSGIMDTINATFVHGPQTRLPSEFYDPKVREHCDKIATNEWFAGYKESKEYRKLGIGALMGDVVDRMVSAAVEGGWRPKIDDSSSSSSSSSSREGDDEAVKFALSGCHDTTIAAILTSLGGFENGKWPSFTSNIAIELFRVTDKKKLQHERQAGDILEELKDPIKNNSTDKTSSPSFFSFLTDRKASTTTTKPTPSAIARTPLSALPPLRNHYVRIRYNDVPVRIPGCATSPAKHLDGDETFCTLEAFKEIVDKFTPADWREECGRNTEGGMFEEGREPAGY